MLTDNYFKHQAPQASAYERAHFFRYGGPLVFGSTLSDELRNGTAFAIHKLDCGCEATPELLEGDKPLMASIVFRMMLESMKHNLANVANAALQDAGLPKLTNDGSDHWTPDFHYGNDHANPWLANIMNSIEHIVKLNAHGEPGWVKLDED